MPSMQLELTARSTGARLEQLASALQLPCPVRESFLFDADHAFRTSCTETDITLQRAIKRVFQHAGVPCDAAVVLWKSGLAQTRVDRDGHSWFFEIPADLKADAAALGVVLAQQAGRALLAERKVGQAGDHDRELAAILSGLGSLLLVPQATRLVLSPANVRYAFVRTFASLGIPLSRALDVVPEKLPIVWRWLSVSRRPLPFAKLEPHVVIRCFCAKRLRVPTGSVGETTCPACKRRRPFDGRPCRVAIRTV